MFAKNKVSQSMIDAVNKVLSENNVDEASVKVPTKTGTMVYGGAKGGSAKAYLKQKYGDNLDDIHGPSDKELKSVEKEKKKEVDEEVEDVSEMDYGGGKNPYAGHGQNDDDEGGEKRTPEQIKKDKAEWNKISKIMGVPKRTGLVKKDDTISDLTKHLNYHLQKAKVKKEEVEASFASRLLQSIREGKGNQPQETIYEAEAVTKSNDPNKTTTDMLSGRVRGGKSNSFKSFKLQLKTDGEMKAPDVEKGEDTKEKQKISTNPGPVDIKLDDKLTGPTPYSYFKNKTTSNNEEVKPALKAIRSKEKKVHNKEIEDFSKKVVESEEIEYFEINEEKPEHTHVAHFEDKNGQWMAKLLINAKHDGHAIDQANEASGKGPFGGLKVRKVERVTKVMEDVDLSEFTTEDIEQFMQTEDYQNLDELSKEILRSYVDENDQRNEESEGSWRKETDWKPSQDTVQDKSGAKHTPISRVKHLAKQAMNKVKDQTMVDKKNNKED